jgi:thiamine-monophosphate kinase
LQHALGGQHIADIPDAVYLMERLNRPTPRIQAALALRSLCHAAIDISDGFVQDLGHVLAASELGARIDVTALPLSAALQRQCHSSNAAIDLALSSGDDYELCLSLPAANWPAAISAAAATGVQLTRVGEMVADRSLQCFDHGKPYPVTVAGYDHFGAQS